MRHTWSYIRAIYERRDLLRWMTLMTLRAGHRNKVLGNIWFLLDPLLQMALYYVIFGIMFKMAADPKQYVLFLLSGIFVMTFFTNSVQFATASMRRQAGLILSNYFPLGIVPMSVVLFRLYDFVCGIAALLLVMIALGHYPTVYFLWVIPLTLIFMFLVVGVSWLVAIAGVFFEDLNNILQFVLKLLFYLSPVLFGLERVPPAYHGVFKANPFYWILEMYRAALLYGRHPDPLDLLRFTVLALVVAGVGLVVIARREGVIAKYL